MSPAADIIAMADDCRHHFAAPSLSPAAAKLYSQHTRLRFQQPGLTSWSTAEASQRFADAVRLLEAGFVLRSARQGTFRQCLRRSAELMEWLCHPEIGLDNVPMRLLSAGTYLLAGYPARADSLLRGDPEEGHESHILRTFFRGDLPDALSSLTEFWATNGHHGPARSTEHATDNDDETWRQWVVDEVLGAIGVICSAMRWGDEERLGDAVRKLQTAGTLIAYEGDKYSWLLAKLCAEVAGEYARTSLRQILTGFGQTLDESGRAALERFFRLAYVDRRLLAWPSQQQGIRRLEQTGSFALCTPTGSGKTLVAELAIMQALFQESPGRATDESPLVLYLVPSRALAAEVEAKMTGVFRRLTTEPVTVTGLYGGTDWGPTDAWLTSEERTVLICTYEKAEALMRFLGPLFLRRIALVVLDEAHAVLFDGLRSELRTAENRSLRLECLGMRLFHLVGRSSTRIIALSAVAHGSENFLHRWVSGNQQETSVRTTYRSTRQLIGRLECSLGRTFSIHYDLLDSASLRFSEVGFSETPFVPQPFPPYPEATSWETQGPEVRLRPPLLWAALHLAAPDDRGERHGVLISITQNINVYATDFLTLLDDTWSDAALPQYFAGPQDEDRTRLWERCLHACEDYFGSDSVEFQLLQKGIVVHHGSMPSLLGRLLVAVVQSGIVTLVMATSTLSEGVNLPLETILVPTVLRSGRSLSAQEFSNLAGRAGRPGVATEGRTLVLLPATRTRRERDTPRWRYDTLIAQIAARPTQTAQPLSPLSELLDDIWDSWKSLSGTDDRRRFLAWLETTAPAQFERSEDDPSLPPELAGLDTLDAIVLSAIVESEEINAASALEDQLGSIWRSSFAAIVAPMQEEQEVFLRRAHAVPRNIYPEQSERRRLYRTGLPPCSAYQLLNAYPTIRDALMAGADYFTMTSPEKLTYIDGIVGLIGSVDRFRYEASASRTAIDWHRALAWWLAPQSAPHVPSAPHRAKWFSYVSKNFVYKFAWGLGSVIGLATDDVYGDQLTAMSLESWPNIGLPWVVFWMKELITWGTLEPIAAYLLGRGLADTRPAAEELAEQYEEYIRDDDIDPLNALTMRSWVDEHVAEPSAPSSRRALRDIPAEPVEDFDGEEHRLWNVLPRTNGHSLLWIDPAGYVLARSRPVRNWDQSLALKCDFKFDPIRKVVTSSWYL
jgi:DEAD/DEAH box helicase